MLTLYAPIKVRRCFAQLWCASTGFDIFPCFEALFALLDRGARERESERAIYRPSLFSPKRTKLFTPTTIATHYYRVEMRAHPFRLLYTQVY